jgi:hypothetical protein
MTDITERLRSIYVAEGTNYVQEAADLIVCLRAERKALVNDITAERDGWKSLAEQRNKQMETMVNDVHSCGPTCQKAGCVNRRLREALTHISLCSKNSMSSKDECGSIARAALGEPK